MSKVLVTGGAGFIGSNLAHKLVEQGKEVTILDTLYLGKKENVPDEAEFVKGSVLDDQKVIPALEDVDTVFHLAARSSAPMHKENPQEGLRINIEGFVNIAEHAMDSGVDRMVYASTSSMYGSIMPPHKENAGESPVNRYSASKMSRELYSKVYSDKGLNITGLRFFSVYGPRERQKGKFANIISQFLWAAMDGEKPKIFGDGTQTRDFTYVEDIVRGTLLAAKKGKSGEVYNLGTGTETSFNKVIDILEEKLGEDTETEHVENPIKNYVQRTKADISKAEKDLGYNPNYGVEQGIEKTIEYYTSE